MQWDTNEPLILLSSHIQGRIQIGKELHQLKLGNEATKGQELIRSVEKVIPALRLAHFLSSEQAMCRN